MNYIVVPDLKIVVETDSEEIEEFEEKAFDEGINEDFGSDTIDGDVGDSEITELTVKDVYTLYKCYDIVQSISGIELDKIILYWLRCKGLEYQIVTEIDERTYQKEGYTILPFDN